MKAKRRMAALVILAVVIPALWAVVRAADKPGGSVPQLTFTAEQRDTLRGLQGVQVLVEDLKPEVERLGLLTQKMLQIDAELQLRKYGIRVLSRQENLVTLGSPFLYVNVGVIGEGSRWAASIEVSLIQSVSLRRDPTMICYAKTWYSNSIATGGADNIGRIRDTVKDHISKFINDYLAVNPKDGKTKEESRTKEEAADSKP